MNTKLLMSASAIFMGALGVTLTFLPDEVLNTIGATPDSNLQLIVQLLGALYFGFAIMNWMGKAVLIGGIYAKPLSMGNFYHFIVGGLALLKGASRAESHTIQLWILAIVYLLFAAFFGKVFMTNPKMTNAV